MPFDQHKNLAISTVTVPPTPLTSGDYLYVAAGEGARFPAPPFNATVWPAGQIPTPANAEVLRVTGITVDGFNIVRAQEGSTARAIVAGDLLAATITAKVITDIEAVGGWLAQPYNAAHYLAASATWTVEAGDVVANRFCVIGRTLHWYLSLQASSLSAPSTIRVRVPAGLIIASPAFGSCKAYDGVAWQNVAVSAAVAPTDYVDIQRLDFSPWPAGVNSLYLQFTLTCEVTGPLVITTLPGPGDDE